METMCIFLMVIYAAVFIHC